MATGRAKQKIWNFTTNQSVDVGNNFTMPLDAIKSLVLIGAADLIDTTGAIVGGNISSIINISDASTISFDAQAGIIKTARLILSGNHTLNVPSNACDGQYIRLEVKQFNPGGFSLTLGSGFDLGGRSLKWSTIPGAIDFFGMVYRQTENTWYILSNIGGY